MYLYSQFVFVFLSICICISVTESIYISNDTPTNDKLEQAQSFLFETKLVVLKHESILSGNSPHSLFCQNREKSEEWESRSFKQIKTAKAWSI